jgi:ABC-type bacteriocin/lantibiotic exporter with double-glycine peptidase domain
VGIFMPKNKKLNYKSAFLYLFKFIKPHKKWYLTATVISLVLVGTGLLNARVTQMLVDCSISGDASKIISSLIMFIIIISANVFLSYISGICVSKLSASASMDLKRHISKILLHAKYGEIIKLQSGDTLSTVNSDTTIVSGFIAGDLIGLFSQFTMALGAIIYLLCVSPFLALVTFLYTPIGMFFTLSLNHKMNKLYPLVADYKGEALSVVEQALSQIPVIKSFIMEKQIKKKIYEQYNNVYKTEMKISVWNSLLQTACGSTSSIPRMIFMIFAGYMVMHHNLTIGAFISILDLLSFIIGPTVYFPFMLNSLNNSIASINRIKRLENIPQVENTEKAITSNAPAININNITFGYSDDKFILNEFSFSHQGNGVITICGDSGMGKTTLLDSIAGLYQPKCGSIDVNGDISVVSQDTYLFSTSLIENVRLAKTNATDEEVIEALKMAGADEFAKALPNSYNTMLGDGNSDLSGGQKQRISLARTILTNNPIWLLDEPTSALDTQTENIILDVIRKMSKEKLIIISAHRKSLIDIADRVIHLNNVKVLEGVETI